MIIEIYWFMPPLWGWLLGANIFGYNLVTSSTLKQSRVDDRIIECDECKGKQSRRDDMIIDVDATPSMLVVSGAICWL